MTCGTIFGIVLCGVCAFFVVRLYAAFSSAFDGDFMPDYDIEAEDGDGRF